MAEIIDQIVNISIQDTISGVTTVDVNTVALVGLATETSPVAGEFSSVAGAVTAYGADSELAAMVRAFFAQDSQPSRVVCIPAADTAAGTLAAVQNAAKDFDFYHIVMATWDESVTDSTLVGSNGWQEWLADAKKVLHIQVKDPSSLKNLGGNRIAIYKHDEIQKITQTVTTSTTTTVTELTNLPAGWEDGELKTSETSSGTTTTVEVSVEFLNVGIVALRCASDSARGTFAHKKCKGVTADSYSVEQYNAWIDGGINIYVKVSGEARLFMGTTSDSEHFIDQIVKDDWIRFNVQSRIYKLLGEGNDGNGVNYDDAGIGAVAASVLNVLTLAQDTDHQYVMADSANVEYKPYSYLIANYAEDVRKRNLPLIKGHYARMNSIHTVDKVDLYVTL